MWPLLLPSEIVGAGARLLGGGARRAAIAIARFPWDRLQQLVGDSPALLECARFMLLKALHKDLNAELFSPSAAVDRVWRGMLLFPVQYARMCARLFGMEGRLIDHNPLASLDGSPEGAAARARRQAATADAYRALFAMPMPMLDAQESPVPGTAVVADATG